MPTRLSEDFQAEIISLVGPKAFETRSESGIVRPQTQEQTIAIVKACIKHHVPYYPVHSVINLGYGAATPVTPDVLLIDLSALKTKPANLPFLPTIEIPRVQERTYRVSFLRKFISLFFEFEDHSWLPSFLRDGITDYLRIIIRLGRLYDPVLPLVNSALQRLGENQILDCCSGAGGPWLDLYSRLKSIREDVQVTLSDYFPNPQAISSLMQDSHYALKFVAHSIDATNIPAELKGFRTFFTSFHHFEPVKARQILRDAMEKQTGIGVFESTQRHPLAFLWMALAPVVVWILTPFIRPFSWKRLFFTYVVPVIPFLIAWDGWVSCLRTYSVEELRELTASLEGNYEWQIGEVKGLLSPVGITYLIGIPRKV